MPGFPSLQSVKNLVFGVETDIDNGRRDYAYNVNSGLRKYRAALAKFEVGLADLSIQVLGDSVSEGFYTANRTVYGYPYRLRQKLIDKGYASKGEGLIHTLDARLTGTYTGWQYISQGAGGVCNTGHNGNNDPPMVLNINGKTIKWLYYSKIADNGGVGTVQIDAETPVNIDYGADALPTFHLETITAATDGAHTVTVTSPTDTAKFAFARGIWVEKEIEGVGFLLHNTAVSGMSTAKILQGNYTAQMLANNFDYTQPHLTILALGLNDSGGSIAVATYKANMQTLIDKALLYGSVLLVALHPGNESTTNDYVDYVTAMYELADTNDCALLDMEAIFGTFAVAQPLGLFSTGVANNDEGSDVHPSARGHQFIADVIGKIIF